jgi:hypothetical protein
MKNYCLKAVLALIVFFISPYTVAQQVNSLHYRQYLQDVFKSELVYPQEKSEFQFTLMPEFQKSNDFNSINIPFNTEFGITDSWQVGFSLNSIQKTGPHLLSANGISDLQIGSKYSFMNMGNTNFHTALGFEISIPLKKGDNNFGNKHISYEPYVLLAIDIPKLHQIQLFAMTSLESFCQKSKPNEEHEPAELNLNGGFFIPYKYFVLTSEFSCNTSKLTGGNETQLCYTPGVVFNLPGAWEAGVGFPLGLNRQSDNFGVIAMITFEFNISGKKD